MIDPWASSLPCLPDGIAVTHDHLLNGQVQITQPKTGYRVGNDAVLAAASLTSRCGRVLDLGAGVGGISLCVAKRLESLQITAVEIDPAAVVLARYNVATNGMNERVRVVETDIAAMSSEMASSFDQVISNPPYHHKDGTRPRHSARAIAHIGGHTNLEDWVNAAVWAVKPRGRINFICRADRVVELITLFDAAGAGEMVLYPLWSRPMSPAKRVIVQLRKGVTSPSTILPGLIVHNDDGSFTEAAKHIMKGGALYLAHPARAK